MTLGEVTLLWEMLRGFRSFSETKFSETETLKKLAEVSKPKCHTLEREVVWL